MGFLQVLLLSNCYWRKSYLDVNSNMVQLPFNVVRGFCCDDCLIWGLPTLVVKMYKFCFVFEDVI